MVTTLDEGRPAKRIPEGIAMIAKLIVSTEAR
jgi:hypothetical protein